jgi:hypothetical protein
MVHFLHFLSVPYVFIITWTFCSGEYFVVKIGLLWTEMRRTAILL